MKIQTTNLGKGGGGKTTDTFNEGDWLARVKGLRTLLIDGAWECNLTRTFDVKCEKTVYDIFTTGEYEIVPISENLSLICGDERLTDEQLDLASRNNKYLQLFMWFSEHYEELEAQFDVILIDTHNDERSVFEQHEEMTANQKETHQKFYDNINYVYENILSVLEGEVA